MAGMGTAPVRAADVDVVAHRGASADAPENTLPAFELAWEQGADAIEGDFWLAGDGEVVCIHDATTERVAGREIDVRKSTSGELRELDVGSWKGERWVGTRVPSLAEVLATVPPGKRVFIEIKDSARAVPAVSETVAASGLGAAQVCVIAFDEKVVAAAKRAMPAVAVFWLVSQKSLKKIGVARAIEMARAAGADGIDAQAGDRPSAELVEAAAAAGLELHTWTVDQPEQARLFAEAGYRSVTTNRPAAVREALGR